MTQQLDLWKQEWDQALSAEGPQNNTPNSPSSVAILSGVEDLDIAVASGAAYYGWTKETGGLRIRGGTARSYYVGIETAGLAVPGMARPIQAVCVAPKGMEEGTESTVPSKEVGLVVGKPVRFRFFVSSNVLMTHLGQRFVSGTKMS